MMQSLRRSFAAKLVALEVGTILLAVTALAGFLIWTRVQQTQEVEQKLAASNVSQLEGVLSHNGSHATSFSNLLATSAPVVATFDVPGHASLSAQIDTEVPLLGSEQILVALDATGRGILARQGGAPAGKNA